MFYLTYLVVVYIALNHSFKIINTLPDQVFKWLNIKTMGDDSSISQLQAEQMLKTVLANSIVTSAFSGPNAKIDQLKNDVIKGRKERKKEQDAKVAEDNVRNMQMREQSQANSNNNNSSNPIDDINESLNKNARKPDKGSPSRGEKDKK